MVNSGIAFLLLFAAAISPAYAYLDPGTGSLIIQGLLAGIAMVLLTIKMYWQKLLSLFHSLFRKSKPKITDSKK